MAVDDRRICVCNLPSDVDEDDLELFFESKRYCPAGGTVEKVEMNRFDETAVVTFEDQSVAERLLVACVRWREHLLHISPFIHINTNVLQHGDHLEENQETMLSSEFYDHSYTDKVSSEGSCDRLYESDSSSQPYPGTTVDTVVVKDEYKEQEEFDFSDYFHSYSYDAYDVGVDECDGGGTVHSELQEREFELDIDDTIGCASVADSSAKSEENLASLDTNFTRSMNSSLLLDVQKVEKELPVPEEKFKLLSRLLNDGAIYLECEHNVNERKGVLELSGSTEEVTNAQIRVYELLAVWSTEAIKLTKGVTKLILSDRGQRWVKGQLEHQGFMAVLFCKDRDMFVTAVDDATVLNVKSLLSRVLASRTIPFQKYHTKFLQSKTWMDVIDSHETASMLHIETDYQKQEIIIEGEADAVKNVSTEVSTLMKKHSKIERSVKLKYGEIRLLKYHQVEIENSLKNGDSDQNSVLSMHINIDGAVPSLTLCGCEEEVDEAEKLIRAKYISAIVTDNFEIKQPGFALEDFTTQDSQGEMAIEYIQNKYRCAIEIHGERRHILHHSKRQPVRQFSLPAASSVRQQHSSFMPSSHPQIKVVKGNITEFKADVLVNVIASRDCDLSRAGAVAKAFLSVAGQELQQDLEQDWPQHFGQDIISTDAYGNIPSQKIYHAAVRKFRNAQSLQRLYSTILKCLNMAVQDRMSSIAFPTVGCGYLGFTPQQVVKCFIDAHKAADSQLTIYIVAFEDQLCQNFMSCLSGATAGSPLTAQTPQPPLTRNSDILIEKGSLPEFAADVLVNLIGCNNPNLNKAGVISKTFLGVAGPKLQQEFARQSMPQEFGRDVAVTSACGLRAKQIYHAAIRHYRDDESTQLLYKMICQCLSMAAQSRMSSIAFPTVGCGRLGYDPAAVADCFVRAQAAVAANLRIHIVAFEDDLYNTFTAGITRISRTPKYASKQRSVDDESFADDSSAGPLSAFRRFWQRTKPAKQYTPEPVALQFEITALDQTTIQVVKTKLRDRINEMVHSTEIMSSNIDKLDKQTLEAIREFESVDVSIEIDKSKNAIVLKGKKPLVDQCKDLIAKLVKKKEKVETDVEHIKRTGDISGYLTQLGSQEGTRYPHFWSKDDISTSVIVKRKPLDPKSPHYKEVEKLIVDTSESDKIGHGQDAVSLSYSKLVVRKIWVIENPSVYRRYYTKKKEMCLNAAGNRWPKLSGLQGERDVRTNRGLKHLDKELTGELNEFYLFHGTKQSYVDPIQNIGLDNRVTADKAMFGKGLYFAESSTKADQYADDRAKRTGNRQPLFMYVVRVLLGNTFICQKPRAYSKPPCTFRGCHNDVCTTHPFFDSVIGTHRADGVRLIFREFIVYDFSQTYPEYLVEYERQ